MLILSVTVAIAEFSTNHFLRFHKLILFGSLSRLFTEARLLPRKNYGGFFRYGRKQSNKHI